MEKELLLEEIEYYEKFSKLAKGESKILAILTLEDLEDKLREMEGDE